MRKRTRARECALQVLYTIDLTGEEPREVLPCFWEVHPEEEAVVEYTALLVEGVVKNRPSLDEVITTHAKNWDMERMTVIDRNILRMAAFELLHLEEVPPKVALNEAIDIAKRYGDKDSGKFVNGILDKIAAGKLGNDATG